MIWSSFLITETGLAAAHAIIALSKFIGSGKTRFTTAESTQAREMILAHLVRAQAAATGMPLDEMLRRVGVAAKVLEAFNRFDEKSIAS